MNEEQFFINSLMEISCQTKLVYFHMFSINPF